ncbi:rRNA (guanine(1405)-N(7))-methyltransferase [Candidatus Nanobsidianus stetteri]|uniref:rRNA (Guanine(1405)-N(7))-methyltransferase n=1 Tax=Nanobsidianus stetteri TaxID=1294122 RepID=R1GA80_NANST|nr:rRNA (guanine(1405)-N(7))-methyltransferase [Candidatus Nanobsidianus stetteri]
MELFEIINEIKNKKELRNISDKVVENILKRELRKKQYLYEKLSSIKSIKQLKNDEEFYLLFKEVRRILHELYGLYTPKEDKEIDKILFNDEITLEQKIIELLMLTRSTAERLNFYKEIYKNIFIEKPLEILDLASGLNPISIYFSDQKPKKYYYVDISEKILDINYQILKELNIENEGWLIDLLDPDDRIFGHYQYIFFWKIFPILEKYDFYAPRNLLSKLDFDYLIISFPQKSLGKKRNLGLAWRYKIKRFVTYKLKYKVVKEFDIPYEYFVIIRK